MLDKDGNIMYCECGKRIYSSKEADLNISRSHNHRNRRDKLPCRKYYCDVCGYYHLTSKSYNYNSKYARRKKKFIKTKYKIF